MVESMTKDDLWSIFQTRSLQLQPLAQCQTKPYYSCSGTVPPVQVQVIFSRKVKVEASGLVSSAKCYPPDFTQLPPGHRIYSFISHLHKANKSRVLFVIPKHVAYHYAGQHLYVAPALLWAGFLSPAAMLTTFLLVGDGRIQASRGILCQSAAQNCMTMSSHSTDPRVMNLVLISL